MPIVYKATAPGSCMFFGEYSVLFNQPALVFAINRYITVTLLPRSDDKIIIHSALGQHETTRKQISITPPFEFVLSAISSFEHLSSGFDLQIEAQFSDQLGFGSSAAVTVATLACLYQFTHLGLDKKQLLLSARHVIQSVQGLGSGADVAASIYGGLIRYQMDNTDVTPLTFSPDIHLIYSGHKVKTKHVVANVLKTIFSDAHKQTAIEQNGVLVKKASDSIATQDWRALSIHLQNAHAFFHTLNASTETLDQLITSCQNLPACLGAKISGAGFGDCILAVGELAKKTFPQNEAQKALGIQQFDLALSNTGVVTTKSTMEGSH